jgi:hypothetical protein
VQKFTKITVGFVTQSYEKNDAGKFVCTGQEFIAGDSIDYEDANGNTITPPDHEYQPFNMTLVSRAEIIDQLGDVLISIEVGGEQARQFAEEIAMQKYVLKTVPVVKDNCPKCGAGFDERELISKDFLGIEAIHMHYLCKKCDSEIIEEFTLTNVFIDNPTT